MKTTILLALLVSAVPAATSAVPTLHHSSSTESQIAKQFDIWNSALQTGNPKTVAALYCEPGAVLLPTVSNRVRTTQHGIVDYFTHFLKSKPVGHIDQSHIRILGPDAAINSGIYTFTLTKDGKASKVQARYTYVYEKRQGKWCIMDHHSSAMPETVKK